jgi:branched-chain amino acid aminotransferase
MASLQQSKPLIPECEHTNSDTFTWCWMNGEVIESANANVSIFDRGYLYGDGLFETLRMHQGNLFQWDRHWARLESGCEGLGIPMGYSEVELKTNILDLAQKNKTKQCMARIQVSRGPGARGYLPPKKVQPTWSITLHPAPVLPPLTPRSWSLALSKMRTPSDWAFNSWKTTNKLFQTLIKQDARDEDADDAIVLNESGHITEISCANLFLVMRNQILTPPLASGVLPGTTRALFLDLAKQIGIPSQEINYDLKSLKQADSVFASLSSFGLIHIKRIQDVTYEMHPIELKLYNRYLKHLEAETSTI